MLLQVKTAIRTKSATKPLTFIYHLTVMLVDNGMTWEDIYKEMERRSN